MRSLLFNVCIRPVIMCVYIIVVYSLYGAPTCCYDHVPFKKTNLNMHMLKSMPLRHVCISAYSKCDKS